jgi:alpha-beta hydrolase superfamily lysophospholipase
LAAAHFVTADATVLPVRHWLPAAGPVRAVLVALHGFNDYSKFFEAPGGYLRQRGVACYAYDQRGFGHAPARGEWPGTAAYVDDLRDFVDQVRRRHPGVPVYLLGESMGGAVAIVAAASPRAPAFDGMILAAPAVWGRATMPWYQRWLLAFTARILPELQLTGEGLNILPSDNIEMLRGLGRDPLVIKATRVDAIYGLANLMDRALERAPRLRLPTLLLYGEKDQVVPREPVYRMIATMPAGVRTAFYEQGYHLLLRDLHADRPWADIVAWIGDHDAPFPSGADRRQPRQLAMIASQGGSMGVE